MRVGRHWPIYGHLMQRYFSRRRSTVSFCVAVIYTLSITCSVPISSEEIELLPLCPAGSYLSESFPEKCLACKGGATYMDRLNREHACNPCTKCDSLMILVTPCSVTADAHCECHEAYFKNVEGKCSPKLILPVASTVRSYVDRMPDVGSSSSRDKMEYLLNVVVGLIISVVVLILLKIVIDTVWRCHQQKRTTACSMGCSLRDHRDEESGTFHSKRSRCYDRPGQVADEQEKLIDATSNPLGDSPVRHLATIASAPHAYGLDVAGVNDPSSSARGIQAGGEQSTQSKKERSSYSVAMNLEADDKCDPSERHSRSSVLNNSTAGSVSTSV